MLILFGVRRLRRQLGVVLLLCQRCQQPCAHSILCVKTFFTLFFIPVIPLGSRYYLVCSMCAGSSPIDKADAECLRHAAVQQAAQPAQMTPDGPITPYGRAELPSATPALGFGSPNPPSGPPQGWYPDPSGGSMQRWWDGARWTDHVQAMAPPAP